MSRRWIEARKRDYYVKMAKRKGYRSRAAFKLLEANARFKFIRRGDVVVDLGAAPGGWMQVARDAVGDSGFVLGVDLKPIEPLGFPNVKSVVGDLFDPTLPFEIERELPRKADVVICDAAPDLSGVWELDHARQVRLVRAALKIAESVLQPRGTFFTKVFQGEELDQLIGELKQKFSRVRFVRPKAVRPSSAEIFVLCSRPRPRRSASPAP